MNIPLWQVLVEGRGTREHGPHVSDDRRIPLWQVLVEGRCTREHGAHVGRHVPLWQVLVRTTCCEARVPLEEITCLGQAGCQAYSTRAWCFTVHGTCRFGAVQTHAALYLSWSICRDTLITNECKLIEAIDPTCKRSRSASSSCCNNDLHRVGVDDWGVV